MKIVEKAWGYEHWIVNNEHYCGKRLVINKGWMCSIHFHANKHETFYVDCGTIFAQFYSSRSVDPFKEPCILRPRSIAHVLAYTFHRFGGITDAVIYEFSTHHEDSDSYRVEEHLSGPIPKEMMDELAAALGREIPSERTGGHDSQ